MPDSVEIVDLHDDDAIVPVLEQDRTWAAYALCDLEPPHRAHARYVGAVRDGRVSAAVLAYTPPDFTSLSTYGEPSDVAAILAAAHDLPASAYIIVRRADVPALETRYYVETAWTMLRYVVTPATLRPAHGADVSRLSTANLPELRRLYALWPQTVFTPSMLEHGVYYGCYDGVKLIAVAGTHAHSLRHCIGVIGNVFTHPAHRGKGLAQATTEAVVQALMRDGAREVALNVREDNAPAIATYTRLGFSLHIPFHEGRATLR